MKPNHYTEIPPNFTLNLEILGEYDIHKHISARGITFIHPGSFDVSAIVKVSLKMISLTGSVDFLVKVLKCTKLEGESLYELHCNFYDTNAEKEDEVLGFIKSF
ncbi:PilZ domain-containing protein [Leptospira sp. 'Mane']|uniref:PilZ domain-containing protein n=1 Tax=Leptospira sp. 'Mane' TaxID=3387407 RepID=UPI00398B91F9